MHPEATVHLNRCGAFVHLSAAARPPYGVCHDTRRCPDGGHHGSRVRGSGGCSWRALDRHAYTARDVPSPLADLCGPTLAMTPDMRCARARAARCYAIAVDSIHPRACGLIPSGRHPSSSHSSPSSHARLRLSLSRFRIMVYASIQKFATWDLPGWHVAARARRSPLAGARRRALSAPLS